MASSRNEITAKHIVRLADALSADSMTKIARDKMKFGMEDIIPIEDENMGNKSEKPFIREVLRKWAYKSAGSDQVKELAAILYEAADDNIGLTSTKIEEILGVSKEKATGNLDDSKKNYRAGYADGIELTEKMRLNLAQQITTTRDLHELSVLGLKVPPMVVDRFSNYRDIKLAAYEILQHWFLQQENNVQAYHELCKALKNIKKAAWIRYLEDI